MLAALGMLNEAGCDVNHRTFSVALPASSQPARREPAFGIERRLAAHARRGHRLAVVLIGDISRGEDTRGLREGRTDLRPGGFGSNSAQPEGMTRANETIVAMPSSSTARTAQPQLVSRMIRGQPSDNFPASARVMPAETAATHTITPDATTHMLSRWDVVAIEASRVNTAIAAVAMTSGPHAVATHARCDRTR
ncbi:MAG: hypothetical protein KF699_06050 [Phycisphaeraceae bacterium]|nr:hypothetical protein [Phycisphaeraceae bacterium]